jgi:hypothetical protein
MARRNTEQDKIPVIDAIISSLDKPAQAGQGPRLGLAKFNFPTFQLNVSLDEDEFDLGSGRAMTTSADAMPRQSGSPMFGRWTGDPVAYAVAVISAQGGGDNWCAGGSDLKGIVRHARTQNP